MIYKSVSELIGKTPLVELTKIEEGLNARILAKLEFFNPAGSVKDRVAKNMIEKAEKEGKLKPGSVIIEPTSGNTGIGIAAVAASKGYRAVIVMPETMSVERQRLMKAYGAELVLTEGVLGMQGAIAKAEELCRSIEGSIIAGQFTNPSNPEAHYLTTGPEIWEDTAGNIDFFVAGIGTGGTITGVGKYLKEKNPEIKIIGVEPSNSPFISKGEAGPHGLQGIGAGFKPEILDTDIIDEIITVSENEAYNAGRALARCEGILTGITSGASLFASLIIASRPENEGKTVVALLPDTGERYLSCEMYR
jgi:cysteine synthase A